MTGDTQPIGDHVNPAAEPEINKYFRAVIKANASDLHLKVGQPPKLRINEDIKSTTGEVLTEEKIEKLVFEILSEKQKQFFTENGSVDFAYELSQTDRFRVNIFRQRTKVSLSARRITSEIPPFESLHLPSAIKTIADKTYEGLIIVAGPTGCGKSTTIASMIDRINQTRSCHIITIEDPLEFIYTDKKAIVSQREIGIDVKNYEDALSSLIKQDPDVVLIGEMRDKSTILAAIRAAETGQIVFGTLHSANVLQTIQRVIDSFPSGERPLVRQTFSNTLRAIINQDLLPCCKKDIPMVPAVEILVATSVIRKLIAEGNESEINGIVKTSQHENMQDFIESLRFLVHEGWIDSKVALEYTPNVDELKMALRGIKARS